ncbi:spore germination protein [Lottiidibacillus patelloidae]|uniref:Spore germination protein n=1 Tax=Lottiidibacillus patelloidae TaxID=2670334 RepID=A0A263BTU8_9BACI|nr:spore germination protein [Lottiidibacillus patelloidae]OZM57140.1 spore germination protein [Lottiidibacillus patelloidae]
MTKNNNETPIYSKLYENEKYFKEKIGMGTSFDIGVRKITILDTEVHIYFLNGLCDTQFIIELMKEMVELNISEKQQHVVTKDLIENRLTHQQVSKSKTLDEAVDQLLSGLIIIMMEGEGEAIVVDVRSYPGRSPQEPDTEKVVRGARDGYTENLIENTALTRRRIRDERLRNEILQVGERSKTDVCISYIQDVADPKLVKKLRDELNAIDIDGIPMADKTIEEFLVHQGMNPFPLVRYTERPDVVASHLLEGHVVVMVDTSPSVIITPTTYFHHVQHAEEYRQTPLVGAFLRWVRFIGMIASLYLLPLWLLFVLEPSLLPENLKFIGPNEVTKIPIFVQILFAELGVDMLRMAAIHTPTPLSTAMGLIAAVLIGQIAIDVGLFVPEVILYVAASAIGSFATPSYELGIANKIIRILLLIAVVIFKAPGFVVAATIIMLLMIRIRSLDTPYLWPFIPFNAKALMQIIVRVSVPLTKKRPSIVKPQQSQKQPN